MTPEEQVIPTHEQIVQEAERRQFAANNAGVKSTHDGDYGILSTIIEVVREGWTPPEPVYPDLLAFREWAAERWPHGARAYRGGAADDQGQAVRAYLAGARMAREHERERAKVLLAELDHIREHGSRFDSDRAGRAIAKYEEGLK